MSKRPKFDESGDSDELQALFDSIAADPVGGPDSLNTLRAAAPVLRIRSVCFGRSPKSFPGVAALSR